MVVLTENLTFGGINRYCLDLVDELMGYPDVTVSLVALGDASEQWLLQEAATRRIAVEELTMKGTFDLQVVKRLRELLVDQQVDILHSQAYRGNMIARLAVRLGNIKPKLICTIHGLYQPSSVPLRSKMYYALDYLTLSTSDHIIPVSEVTRHQVTAYCRGKPVTTIYNGTRLVATPTLASKLESRRQLSIPEDTKVISFIGRLDPQKGVENFISVARRTLDCTTNVVFLVVGDGRLRYMVEEFSQEYNDRVILAGFQRDISDYYRATDILLVPSPMEGLPMVLLEAFAHGIPVVASNVGGIPEAVTDGYNGFLCKPTDSEGMHRRLLQILNDRKLQQELGNHAQNTIENGFSLARMVEATYQVYLSTVKQSPV